MMALTDMSFVILLSFYVFLLPHCAADIVGFTAWSSVRDPTQVFTLLETLYNSFDSIAKRRGVFKVSEELDQ